jgi:hypothetical protein
MRASISLLAGAALASLALALVPAARAQQDPSLQQVMQTVHDGRLSEAQAMMTTVLRDHPDSARAHYVEAEVLVRLDRASEAQAELERAEHLAPGLPFARPDAVRDLRGLIAQHGRAHAMATERAVGAPVDVRPADSGFPWGVVLIVVGAGLVLFMFMRSRRSPIVTAGPGGSMVGPAGAAPYGAPGYGPAPMGGGMGSGIVGGLATGVAVGAGMVAGEALAHELMGGRERDRSVAASGNDSWDGSGASSGASSGDFGVSSSDSWDSGGSGGDVAGGGGGGDWG